MLAIVDLGPLGLNSGLPPVSLEEFDNEEGVVWPLRGFGAGLNDVAPLVLSEKPFTIALLGC